ncbi:MAG: transcription antitermination factor NusB [Actinobacteria bacterium RBG_16_70_17]|nr:MAG: transcription antitermination factor NusB [Actinobacteria bacterium RBG_16_70_17]
MTDPAVVALARALAEASSEEELAGLARAEADADGTWRLRAAVALLRAAAAGEETPVPVPDAGTLFRVGRLIRRDEVVEALYEADLRDSAPDVAGLDELGTALADGVWAERAELDEALGAVSSEWRVERMPAVDRTVLRLGVWELRHRPELSAGVIISEAVRLAKAYSTERSGAFVNGILGRLAGEVGPG